MVLIVLKMMGINEVKNDTAVITVSMSFRTKEETLGSRKNFGKIGPTINKRMKR